VIGHEVELLAGWGQNGLGLRMEWKDSGSAQRKEEYIGLRGMKYTCKSER
jgi:hypothetical protein